MLDHSKNACEETFICKVLQVLTEPQILSKSA